MRTPAPADVSFVIASRNRAAELATVVARLLDTTVCPIVVVDNASTDDTAEVVGRMAARSAGRLRLVELADNLGAVGRNVGVAACRTPYVAFCDDDSWWAPDAPAIGVEAFERHPSVGLLAARTIVLPQHREDPFSTLLADSALGRRPDLPGPSILGFMSCAAMVRKWAFEQAGGFSDILHFRGEEQLLALDLAAAGWDLCYYPRLVAIHQPSSVRATTAAQAARVLRNDVLTTWLRRPIRQCLNATGRLGVAALRDREHARGAVEAVARLPAVIARRRRLPRAVEQAVALLESG
ncbi:MULTISPECIES: glycosyltransferase family 2 protein [unclassified Mycobacterium]|uniref:glycosyltransferase family 2 protein n=1 Tax=unclassified Mycobacterium TaxID=2642494 RepID=UPI00073FC956|nr:MULTISPECIES: glycosyltransferase family 2 protein [unclassified Mycobacterium]KUH89333.1 transferase [Mycobacterium sp. GA-1999]KUH89495.1 transferase [Mycobacterium sp. GA-0227b]